MKFFRDYGEMVEKRLGELLAVGDERYKTVLDAMRYSVMLGGKRLRPAIMLEFCRICGGKAETVLDFAAAIEMIHTYSLIHDDLPCMDNDAVRRGKPSCHIAFGEANALLAGDGLLTKAFETAAEAKGIEDGKKLRAISVLSKSAGAKGMIGGQTIDLKYENEEIDIAALLEMYELKTGALIRAAAVIGCILGGADEEKLRAADTYAELIGLAFQIEDDILDETGDDATLGKPTGSDESNSKSTYLHFNGMEKSILAVKDLTERAKESLSVFGESAENLSALADFLVSRKY